MKKKLKKKKVRRKKTKKKKAPFVLCSPPDSLGGKEFENLCLMDSNWSESRGKYTMGRYGVQVSFRKDEKKNVVATPIESLPDFEGLVPGGRQFIIETKVCGGSSFSLHESSLKERQLSHMLRRAKFGAMCFLMVHFSARVLKRREDPAITYAFPVYEDHEFWRQVTKGEIKSLSRLCCSEYGFPVQWWLPKQCRQSRPNIGEFVLRIHRLKGRTYIINSLFDEK